MQFNPFSLTNTGEGDIHLPAIAALPDTHKANAFRLPPLILHPFSGPEDSSVLMESSRASLALQGFLPRPEGTDEDLNRRLTRGRFAELKMLFYIGKDLTRWMEQCLETITLSGQFEGRSIRVETFAVFLVNYIPAHVRTKLEGWGVLDFCALFRRSIGLHSVFAEVPAFESFTPEFLKKYHRNLDTWYEGRLRDVTFEHPGPNDFVFDLYASGEYTIMLEQSWRDAGQASEDGTGKQRE